MARWWHAIAIAVVGPLVGVVIAGPPDLPGGDSEVVVGARQEPDGAGGPETTPSTVSPERPETPPQPEPTQPPAPRPPGEVRVRVYVASTVAGAASNADHKLRAAGYNVLEPAWAPKDQPATTRVLFDPGFDREAQAVAAALGVAAQVAPLPPDSTIQLTDEPDVMVLAGNDLAPR